MTSTLFHSFYCHYHTRQVWIFLADKVTVGAASLELNDADETSYLSIGVEELTLGVSESSIDTKKSSFVSCKTF